MSPVNQHSRYPARVSLGLLIWMVICAIVVAGAGVYYATLKNEQVAVRTEINKLHREIAVCNMNANQARAKTHALTNRWAMRDRLSQDASTLHDIDRAQIEIARRMRDTASYAVIRSAPRP